MCNNSLGKMIESGELLESLKKDFPEGKYCSSENYFFFVSGDWMFYPGLEIGRVGLYEISIISMLFEEYFKGVSYVEKGKNVGLTIENLSSGRFIPVKTYGDVVGVLKSDMVELLEE